MRISSKYPNEIVDTPIVNCEQVRVTYLSNLNLITRNLFLILFKDRIIVKVVYFMDMVLFCFNWLDSYIDSKPFAYIRFVCNFFLQFKIGEFSIWCTITGGNSYQMSTKVDILSKVISTSKSHQVDGLHKLSHFPHSHRNRKLFWKLKYRFIFSGRFLWNTKMHDSKSKQNCFSTRYWIYY